MEKSFQQERNIAEVLDADEPITQKKNAADIRKLDLTEEAAEELLAARRVTTYHDKEFWMTLPDGTVVHLNYDSHLIYPEKFHGDFREVILSGDAYFLVAKDERHPFVVHTLQGDICDYGTEFYVESVKNTGAVNVVLVSGKVGVKPRNGAEQLMKPSEKASLLNNQVSLEKTDVSPYVAWNTGSFVFVDCRLDKLMNVLSGWNNVKVTFANEKMKEIRFNGNNIYYEAGDLQISGSSLQATYEEKMSGRTMLNQMRAEFERKWRPMHEKMSKMSKEEQAKFKEGDEYKQMLQEDRQFFRTVEEVYGKAIADNKDTFWGPLLMIMQTSYLTADQIPQYEQLSEAAKNSFYGRKVKDEILPVGGVGSTLLDFTLHKEDGTPVKFDDLIKGKKYLYIDFWASWCAPCRKEIPNVKANYEKYKDKGFEVVGISIDTNKAAWQKACEKEQLQWPSFLDRDVANLFKVRAVPTIYIVDANGKIIAMNDEIRGEKLGEKLAELFK